MEAFLHAVEYIKNNLYAEISTNYIKDKERFDRIYESLSSEHLFERYLPSEGRETSKYSFFHKSGKRYKSGARDIYGETKLRMDLKFAIKFYGGASINTLHHELVHAISPHIKTDEIEAVIDALLASPDLEGVSKEYLQGIWTDFTTNPTHYRFYQNPKDRELLDKLSEYLAEGFEVYLAKETAPLPKLFKPFKEAAEEFTRFYQKIVGGQFPNIVLSHEVKLMFDKFIAPKGGIYRPPPSGGTVTIAGKSYQIYGKIRASKATKDLIRRLRQNKMFEEGTHKELINFTKRALGKVDALGHYEELTRVPEEYKRRIDDVSDNVEAIEYIEFVHKVVETQQQNLKNQIMNDIRQKTKKHKLDEDKVHPDIRAVLDEVLGPFDLKKRSVSRQKRDASLKRLINYMFPEKRSEQEEEGGQSKEREEESEHSIWESFLNLSKEDISSLIGLEKLSIEDITIQKLEIMQHLVNGLLELSRVMSEQWMEGELKRMERLSNKVKDEIKDNPIYRKRGNQPVATVLQDNQFKNFFKTLAAKYINPSRALEDLCPTCNVLFKNLDRGNQEYLENKYQHRDFMHKILRGIDKKAISDYIGLVKDKDRIKIKMLHITAKNTIARIHVDPFVNEALSFYGVYARDKSRTDALEDAKEVLINLAKSKRNRNNFARSDFFSILSEYEDAGTLESFLTEADTPVEYIEKLFEDLLAGKKEGVERLSEEVSFTPAQVMMFYGWYQSENTRDSLMSGVVLDKDNPAVYQFTSFEQVKYLFDKLSPELKRVVDQTIDYNVDVVYPTLNDVHKKIIGQPLDRVNRYLPVSIFGKGRGSETVLNFSEISRDARQYVRNLSSHLSFLHSRTGRKSPVYARDFFDIMSEYHTNAAFYSGMADPLRDLNLLFVANDSEGSPSHMLRQIYGTRIAKEIVSYIKEQEELHHAQDQFIRSVGQVFGRAKTAHLAFSIPVSAAQYVSIVNVLNYDITHAELGQVMGKGLLDPSGLFVTPKYSIKELQELSPFLRERYDRGFIIDPVDSGVKSRAKSWWHNDTSIWEDIKNMKSNTWFKDAMSIAFKIDNKGMLMITMADAWVISKIREAYELHAKNNLWSEKRMDEAFRKAVYRTQPILNSLYTSRFVGSRDIIFKLHHGLYRSARDAILGEMQTNGNTIRKYLLTRKNPAKNNFHNVSAKEARQAIVNILRATYLTSFLISAVKETWREFGTDDELDKSWMERTFTGSFTAFLSLFPLVGDFASAGVSSSLDGWQFTAGETPFIGQIALAVNQLNASYKDNALLNYEERNEHLIKAALASAALLGSGAKNLYSAGEKIENEMKKIQQEN